MVFDPISFGATVGAVMELYEMGVLTKEQIGIEAPFGSAKALTYLAELTARGQGFGKGRAGLEALDRQVRASGLSMSVKGQEFPYDSRGSRAWGWATRPRTGVLAPARLHGRLRGARLPVKTDPLVTDGKAELVKAFRDATAVFDSAGICVFTSFAWTLADVQPQLATACSDEFTMDELNKIGERIWNIEREFNLRAGFTAKDDTLPKRLLTGAGQDWAGQGPGERPGQDAARVLQSARLGTPTVADNTDQITVGAVARRLHETRHSR